MMACQQNVIIIYYDQELVFTFASHGGSTVLGSATRHRTHSCSCSMPDEDAVDEGQEYFHFHLSSSLSFSVFSLLSRSPLASIGVVLLW